MSGEDITRNLNRCPDPTLPLKHASATRTFDRQYEGEPYGIQLYKKVPVDGPQRFGSQQSASLKAAQGVAQGAKQVWLAISLPPLCHRDEAQKLRQFKKRESRRSRSNDSTGMPTEMPMDPERMVHWQHPVALTVIPNVKWNLGGKNISGDICNLYQEFLEDHRNPVGCETHEMMGRFNSLEDAVTASRRPQTYYYHLKHFSWSDSWSKHLPIQKIPRSSCTVSWDTAAKDNAYISYDDSRPWVMNGDHELSDEDIKVECIVKFLLLPKAALSGYQSKPYNLLVRRLHHVTESLPPQFGPKPVTIRKELPIFGPIVDVVVIVQADEHCSRKDWHGTSGINGEDPLQALSYHLGNSCLDDITDPRFWREAVRAERPNGRRPRMIAYTRPFCDNPNDTSRFTGALMLHKDEPLSVSVTPQQGLGNSTLHVFVTTVDTLEVNQKGQCRLVLTKM
jgi:hypothetical protein